MSQGEGSDQRRRDLAELAVKALERVSGAPDEASRRVAEEVVGIVCVITPPSEGPRMTEFLTITSGGRGGGTSVKPGNIVLKPGKLVVSAAKAVTGIAGAVAHPWLAPFTALILWDELYSRLKADLQEREANVAWTLWLHKNGTGCVPSAGLLSLVNAERASYGRGPLSQQELDDALALLKRMGCVSPSRKNADDWYVCEWVRVSF